MDLCEIGLLSPLSTSRHHRARSVTLDQLSGLNRRQSISGSDLRARGIINNRMTFRRPIATMASRRRSAWPESAAWREDEVEARQASRERARGEPVSAFEISRMRSFRARAAG